MTMPRSTSNPPDYDGENARILAGLDVMAEYQALGVVFAADAPRSSGKIECHAVGRDDARPSAYVDTVSGFYGDSGGSHESLSLWDFAAKHASGRFADWQAARRYFAEKAGVTLAAAEPTAKRKRKAKENPADVLDFEDWTPGNERLAAIWCAKHKPGPSVEAIQRAGGLVARYPARVDKTTQQRVPGKYKVIALPCFNHRLTAVDPVAWVLWNLAGGDFEIYRGRDVPPDRVKMKSVGPTGGTLMNRESLDRIVAAQRDGTDVSAIMIHKTAGPSCMLTLMAAIPPDSRGAHLVVANASGEAGDVPASIASWFCGYVVRIVHDRDTAGDIGAAKWLEALRGVAGEVVAVQLPFAMQPKHGADLRDWLLGREEEMEAARS